MFRKRKQRRRVTLEQLISQAEEWDRKYLDVVVHSLEVYDSESRGQIVHDFLSRRNRGAFNLTNPHSKRLWLPELLKSFLYWRRKRYGRSWQSDLEDGQVACALVTLTHQDWACADTNIQFDLQRAKQKVRNALAGTNFIACFEAAPYKNETWVTDGEIGKLICFHCHAIAWPKRWSDLDRLREYIKPRFTPILGNPSGIRIDRLKAEDDLQRALRYMTKMPFLGYGTITNGQGKKTQRSSKITFHSRRQLFHALKQHSLFDFWLGGGEGTHILREPRNRLKKKYKPATRSFGYCA